MTKNDVIETLTKDSSEKNGEIIETTETYVEYMDYQSEIETKFRFEETFSDEEMRKLIFIGKGASENCLTKEFIIDVLKKAFGDDYFDATCTLSGIMIPSNEEEFDSMLEAINTTSDDMREWHQWADEEGLIGHTFVAHQIAMINESAVAAVAKEVSDDSFPYEKEYQIGMLTTLIHEMRHLMLETNPFLPEDEFPESEKEERAVEEFGLLKYESLGKLKSWM